MTTDNLANALADRYSLHRDESDLREAVDLTREALALFDEAAPERGRTMANLARSLIQLSTGTGTDAGTPPANEALDEAIAVADAGLAIGDLDSDVAIRLSAALGGSRRRAPAAGDPWRRA